MSTQGTHCRNLAPVSRGATIRDISLVNLYDFCRTFSCSDLTFEGESLLDLREQRNSELMQLLLNCDQVWQEMVASLEFCPRLRKLDPLYQI